MDVGVLETAVAGSAGPVPDPGASMAGYVLCQRLEDRGAELAGVLAVATAGLVEVLAEAIASEAWRGAGIRSVEHWAGLRFGLSGGRARRLCAAARALAVLPACRAGFAAGEISEDHVAAIVAARVTATHDEQVVGLAQVCSTSQLRRALAWLPPPPPQPGGAEPAETGEAPEAPAEPPPVAERLSTGFADGGTWFISGRADADRGAVIDRALLAAREVLWRARHDGAEPDPVDLAEITGMDALTHLALTALDALDPATADDRPPSERFVVNYHLHADHPDRGHVHVGPTPPAWLNRLLTCDTTIRTWVHTRTGNVDLGRRARTVNPKLRTVIEHRDGGCRIPGCGATRWLTIHHLQHWAHGGPTDTSNLVALCGHHHRAVHRGDLVITGNPNTGTLSITDPDGRPVGPTPIQPPGAPPAQAATDAGLPPSEWTNRSGERADWRWLIWPDHPTPPGSPGGSEARRQSRMVSTPLPQMRRHGRAAELDLISGTPHRTGA